jgi:hypothetical protein
MEFGAIRNPTLLRYRGDERPGAHLGMPATPEKIWQACQKAQQA